MKSRRAACQRSVPLQQKKKRKIKTKQKNPSLVSSSEASTTECMYCMIITIKPMLVEESLHLMWQQERETNTSMCRWDAIIPRLLLGSAAPRLGE